MLFLYLSDREYYIPHTHMEYNTICKRCWCDTHTQYTDIETRHNVRNVFV